MKPSKKLIFKILVYSFASFGLVLTLAWSAVKLRITNDPGGVDSNDRYFQHISTAGSQADTLTGESSESDRQGVLLQRIADLYPDYPADCRRILNHLTRSYDSYTVEKMIQAIELNKDETAGSRRKDPLEQINNQSIFFWMNLPEWPVLKEAVSKDKKIIDSVSSVTGVSSRLISSVLIAEQIRLFDSRREAFKKWIQPLKMLTSETSFSWGVTGIKDFTAMAIEKNLLDSASPYYPGSKYRHLLDFKTTDHPEERFIRITDAKNHFYAYLYAALYMKQVMNQWNKAGYPIEKRPEIVATLYNIGFANSKPKAQPQVGGATIDVGGKDYTFGRIAWEYYYSGELSEVFPYPAQQ